MPRELDVPPQTPRVLAPGTVVAERYRILETAGVGGVGVVYKAIQIHMSRTVALKMLLQDETTDVQVFKRFQQEAKAASQLNHPHIVHIYDFGVVDDGNQAYLAMDFLDGKNLGDVIHDNGRLPIDRFGHIFMQACDAIEHAHKNGVIHRDIKPSNFVLITKGEDKDFLVMVDFGLVKFASSAEDQKLTTTGEVIGSPLYMSPEQGRGVALNHRTDIYSLGCVMYQALTGFPPFLGETSMDTVYKHMSQEPLPMQEINPNIYVPPEVERVVLKAMAKSPELRYQTVAQLRTSLEQALMPKGNSGTVSGTYGSITPPVKDFSSIIKQRPSTQTAVTPDKKSSSSDLWVWLLVIVAGLVVSAAIYSFVTQNINQSRTETQPQATTTSTGETEPAKPAAGSHKGRHHTTSSDEQ